MRRCAAALRTTRHIRRPYLPSPIALSAAAPSGCAPSVQSPRARPERSASPPALVRLPVGLPSRSQRQAPSTQRHARPTHHHHPQPLETHTTAHLSSAACAREALNAPAHAHPRALGATMISCLLLLNAKGDVILQRHYRHDVPKTAIDAFRTKVIGAKESMSKPPVMLYEGCSFLYARHRNMYVVTAQKANGNAALAFEFIFQMLKIFKAYLGEEFTEANVRENFTLFYELLDECMDFGHPQVTGVEVLKMYINLGTAKKKKSSDDAPATLTQQITGVVDWRREGLRYKKNEVYIDVNESVNLLMSASGAVLRAECTGQVMMKTYLSGMPECKFGLNDKISMDKESSAAANAAKRKAVSLDDCSFHRCVRLGKFDAERTITFIPPDGEFELMRYRVSDNVQMPFRIIPAIAEEGKDRLSITLKCIANFSNKLFATNFVIRMPVPPNTSICKINVGSGKAKHEPDQRAIVWKVKKFTGGAEHLLTANVTLMTTARTKAWARPPISVDFSINMLTASGVHVRFLRVFDKAGYTTNRWVRYVTKSSGKEGSSYQIRI